MANSIALFKEYIPLLDEVYKQEAKTVMLDSSMTGTKAGNSANEIVIPKMSFDGMGDYSRANGYVGGDVTLSYETVTFNYDRGRSFSVDSMDDLETDKIAFGKLSSEFVRTKSAPELDTWRFATYAGTTGIGAATAADFTTSLGVRDALVVAMSEMSEAEVPESDRHLFITPTLYNLVNALDDDRSRAIVADFASITRVPQSRFYTAIDLLDGSTSGEEAGGYAKATGAANINFMVFHKPALIQYPKHVVNKAISPEENQNADAWKFFYRGYGIADVYENKVKGIYLHPATT